MKEIGCPVCFNPLLVKIVHGRKSNKPFIMLKCAADGRHFRGFITEQTYVGRVLNEIARGAGSRVGEQETTTKAT